ncbi:DUF4097 family beta strand repeat-containing protein [Streptomyces albiaxialis]|uniref:DUF4097 family beta strand repeat-containing protein n=1 Tax=Streptomyces albiaxialis TaxID=329523 RepID=A0ABN2W3J8_9ACTN
MPEYATPEPLTATLEFDLGTVRITAGERATTVVDVLPHTADDDLDIRTAEQTRVSCSGGSLVVKGPRNRGLFGRSGQLDIRVELPAGSRIEATSPMGDYRCEGPLGACVLRTSVGDIRVEEAASVKLRTDTGEIEVDRVRGDAEVNGAGRIAIGTLAGGGTVKNRNGATTVGEAAGPLSVNSTNGPVDIGVAHSGAEARCANGSVRIREAVRGVLALRTASGNVVVGVREGSAAWLDVHTRVGGVHNALDAADGPGSAEDTVEVRARTGIGDIVVHRS